MKKFLIILMSIISMSSCFNCGVSAAEEEKEENFNFIKSEESDVNDFIYDGSVFLYGGILLVSVSVAGIVFTLLPPKRKNNKKRRK